MRLEHLLCSLIRIDSANSQNFGTSGSEVQVLSPRPIFPITCILFADRRSRLCVGICVVTTRFVLGVFLAVCLIRHPERVSYEGR